MFSCKKIVSPCNIPKHVLIMNIMFKRLGSFFLDILQMVVFAVAIFLFGYLLVLQPHKIKGSSMEPNFQDAEYLLTDKVTYRFNEPKRGDVIVFSPPIGIEGEEFIKRIIGLPGEKITLKEGSFYINDKKLEEENISRDVLTASGAFLKEGVSVVIPENHYFVSGDNRSHSSDSRTWGLITKNKITGRAWLLYWPINKAGTISRPKYNL